MNTNLKIIYSPKSHYKNLKTLQLIFYHMSMNKTNLT